MKKAINRQVHENQLSLFDNFTAQTFITTKNISDDSDINIGWGSGNVGQQQGGQLHDGPGELQGKAIVRHAEGAPAGTFQFDEKTRDIDGLPEQHQLALLPDGNIDGGTGDDDTTGRGTGMARPDGTGRALLNYHNTEPFYDFVSFGKERHLKDNIAALKLLSVLDREQRPASLEEQGVLAKYSGWGGLKEILLDPSVDHNWNVRSDITLRPLVQEAYNAISALDTDGNLGLLKSAQRSIMNAHYTAYPVINAIYHFLEKAGFNGGNILEPSAGIGNFLAAMPRDMANNSTVTAIEMDTLTGIILRKLFPTAETRIAPFEKTILPENSFDLVLSNVPFGEVAVYDPQLEGNPDKAFTAASSNLHNYFFAKSILLARPGGLIALVTSRFTLDNAQANGVRELMGDNCEFLAAVRLPDNAFRANAGTDVVADIILLRKANIGEALDQKHAFMDVRSVPFTDASGKTGMVSYNEYFHDNPANMLGTVVFGGLYDKEGFNLKGGLDIDLGSAIREAFDRTTTLSIYESKKMVINDSEKSNKVFIDAVSLGLYDSIGNIVELSDGKLGIISGENYTDPELVERVRKAGFDARSIRSGVPDKHAGRWLRENGLAITYFNKKIVHPIKVSRSDLSKLRLLTKIRWNTKELIYREAEGWTGPSLEQRREILRLQYLEFTRRFGNLTAKENEKVLALDVDGLIIQSLERKDPVTKKAVPSDILFRQTIRPNQEVVHADNVRDAIMVSVKRRGFLDINLVCELLDKPYEEVMAGQIGDKTEIFIDATGNHVPREDFLSGNILQKIRAEEGRLEIQRSAGVNENETLRSENNINELKKVLPAPIQATDIYAPLHARWLPESDISDFVNAVIKTDGFNISFSRSLDEFKLRIGSENAHSDAFKTQRRKAEWVFEHALNGEEPLVIYTNQDGRQVFDAEDTHLAKEKYKAIRNLWDD